MFELCSFVTTSLTLVYVEVMYNIQCHIFTRKTKFYKKKNAKEYCQKLCQNIYKFSTFFPLVYIWMIQPTRYIIFTIYIRIKNVFNNNRNKMSGIYVIITVSIIQLIYIHWGICLLCWKFILFCLKIYIFQIIFAI